MKPLQEQSLYMAWVFGVEKVFTDLAAQLVLTARSNEDHALFNSNDEDLSRYDLMPPEILGKL